MTEKEKEKMLELLSDKEFAELSAADLAEISELEKLFPEFKNDNSFEIAATAVSLTNLDVTEPLPQHLQAKVLADAEKHFAAREKESVSEPAGEEFQKTFAFEPARRSSILNWLGWAVAGAACIALAINLWTTRFQTPPAVATASPTPTATPAARELTFAEQREQLLASAKDVIKTDWANPKQPTEVIGDVVWSNAAQKGFMRFRALPTNDPSKETYQLWIIDKTQKHPIDGGIFDVTTTGEIIIPIDAKLKVAQPTTFAVTAEKPGGVVVSAQEKVLALAKVVT